MSHYYKTSQPDDIYNNMCFEVLGFDIMLDHKFKPWLIEINHTPSFKTDTPLDLRIKSNLIRDTLNLLNLNLTFKRK
jgi:tubulin polyglutamylase TTLL6/13